MIEKPETQEWDSLLLQAERVLSRTMGGEVKLDDPVRLTDEGRRNLLLRCRVVSAPDNAPSSVVLKRAHQSDYRPDDPASWPAQGLFRDWAGLQFLNEVAAGVTGCPRFYGGDREAGFVLMEDMGAGEDLAHWLLNGTAQEAEEGLLLLAKVLGQMHAATLGREQDYQRIRGALSHWQEEGRTPTRGFEDHQQKIEKVCDLLEVRVSSTFAEDLETVSRVVENPGPFLAYAHGDPCPDNTLLKEGALRLFDYEFGRYRHALLDGVYGRIRFPTCWCVGDIPEPVVERMEAVYRKELAQVLPEVEDEGFYGRALTEACGFWLLDNLSNMLPNALEKDDTWGIATLRQRLIKRLTVFTDLSCKYGHLEGMNVVGWALLDKLRARWNDTADLPLYPAFSDEAAC